MVAPSPTTILLYDSVTARCQPPRRLERIENRRFLNGPQLTLGAFFYLKCLYFHHENFLKIPLDISIMQIYLLLTENETDADEREHYV